MIVESIIFVAVVSFSFARGHYNGYYRGIRIGGNIYKKIGRREFEKYVSELNQLTREEAQRRITGK